MSAMKEAGLRIPFILLLLAQTYHLVECEAQENLFRNPDFEEPLGESDWFCNGCDLERSTDSYQGLYSGRVTNRRARWGSVTQYVSVEGGKAYHFTIMIKLLNQDQDKLWHQFTLTLVVDYIDGSSRYHYLGRSPYHAVDKGWVLIGGDVRLDDKGVLLARFMLQMTEFNINYLVDTATLVEIPDLPADWKEEADRRIDLLRKNDISLRVHVSDNYDPLNTTVEVKLKKHAFPFGSAVRARRFNGDSAVEQKYRDFFFDTFNWAVLENAIKWRLMEWNEGQPDFGPADITVEMLRERDFAIRGHCVVWGVEASTPEWLRSKSGPEVEYHVDRRIQYATEHFRGKVAHWDVNNEQIHGDWFEQTTRRGNYLAEIFNRVRDIDPLVRLFLNDFQIVNEGFLTHAYINSALELMYQGVPLYGIGVQSHIKGAPDLPRIANRLDLVAVTGKPIWVTELDVEVPNIYARARGYEDVLKMYFSHPDVEGVLLWGFWEGASSKPDSVLVDGDDDFIINEAGRRVVRLLREEWWSEAEFSPTSRDDTFEMRGFHGEYEVRVRHGGDVIRTQMFDLLRGQDRTVDVRV